MKKTKGVKALANAILRGAKKRPQTTGELFQLTAANNKIGYKLGASCALGAAYEGEFGTPPLVLRDEYMPPMVDGGDGAMHDALGKRFPILNKEVIYPENTDFDGSIFGGIRSELRSVIISLNDEYGWTRGRIANWLKKLRIA